MMIGMLDIIFFVIILIVSVGAAFKGFVREVLGKAAWILAIILSVLFYGMGAQYLSDKIKNLTLCYICSFVAIFLGVFLVVKIIEVILSKLVKGEIVGGLNRAAGFLLGIAEGLILVFAILFVLHRQPWMNISSITKDSIFNKFYTSQIEPIVEHEMILPASFVEEDAE